MAPMDTLGRRHPGAWRPLATLLLCAGLSPTAGAAARHQTHPADPYVVERVHTEYRFERDGTGRTTIEVSARPQSEAGVHQLGQLFRPYLGVRSRLELEELVVVRPDGTRREAEQHQIRDLPAPVTSAFPIYSDLRVLHATAPSLSPGDRLSYRLVEHLEQPDAPGDFWVEHRLTTGAIVLEETVVLDVPEEVELHIQAQPELPEAEIETADGRRRYRWTTSRTDHRESEAPSLDDPLAAGPADIQASSFEDWDAVAGWLLGLWSGRATPDDAVRRRAEEIVAGLPAGRPQVEALYEFVSSEVRYLALALGLHRYQPLAAGTVLDNGYGDCKDKHTLLAALLEAAGYEAWPVLVSAAREPLVEDVPSPSPFDHVVTVVALGGETLWLDSTSQVAPFGYLPPQVRGELGLRVGHDGSGVVTLPDALPWPAREVFSVVGEVDDEGTLRAEVEQSFRGDAEFAARAVALNVAPPLQKQFVEMIVRTFARSAEVRNVEMSNPTAIAEPFSLRYEIELPGFLRLASGEERIRPAVPPLRLASFDSVEEDEALDVAPFHALTRFDVTLPEGTTAEPPVRVAVERGFASYRADYAVEDRRLEAERELNISVEEIAREDESRYAAFRTTVDSDMKQTFEVDTAAVASALRDSTDIGRLETAASRAAREDDHERAVELYSRIVELSPDHATAWHGLGDALGELDRYDEALEALERQMAIDPSYGTTRNWIAHIHDENGDDEAAMSVYREQLAEFPLDGYANAELGELLSAADRCEEATPFLESAVSIDGDNCTARRNLARCQLRRGEVDRGTSNLERILDSCGDWNVYWAGRAAASNGQPELGMRLVRRAAERGYAEAQTQLAWSYEGGRGVPEDDAAAVEWYRRAVAQDHPRAQAELGWMYDQGRGVDRDHAEAVRLYRRAAEGGNAYGQQRLGRAYQYGRGVDRNPEEAARWYREAAGNGNTRAHALLGWLYETGTGVEKDPEAAAGWYRKGAEAGDAYGQRKLASLYERGEGVPKDEALAVEWQRKAAELGDSDAQLTLGMRYMVGRGVERDYAGGVDLLRRAADQGETSAQYMLAGAYEDGAGVEKDLEKALEWYLRAAEAGDSLAQEELGTIYQQGRGVEPDPEAGVFWLSKAADQGEPQAQVMLGRAYLSGLGVEPDPKLAHDWIARAADQGSPAALLALSELYARGQGVEEDLGRARDLAAQAAEQGLPLAQLVLAEMLASGSGGPTDREGAYGWMLKAADAGFPPGMVRTGEMLESGLGVEEDAAAAVEWARRAAQHGEPRGRYNLGRYYLMGKGVKQDLVTSFAWLSLAAEDPRLETDAEEMMTALGLDEEQRAEARSLAETLRTDVGPGR